MRAADISAAQQAKKAEIATKSRDTKTSTTRARNTAGTTTATDVTKSRARRLAPWTTSTATDTRVADVFSGTVAKVPADNSCMLHALKLGDAAKLRELLTTWLRANPSYPLFGATLAEHVSADTGEPWPEYCTRMQHAHTWGGIPELVAAAQVHSVGIRVFEDVGRGHFHLKAIFGQEFIIRDARTAPIDIVCGSSHYNSLIGARLLKPWEHKTKQIDKLTTSAPHEPEGTVVSAAPKEPATPAPRELEKTAGSAAPKEPATLAPRELEKTAVSAAPKEPKATMSDTAHSELDPATEVAVLERLEQQRRSSPLDLQALLAHPDPLPMLGELLYQLIECHNVELPGKITGMLLEGLSLDELHSLLASLPPGDAAAALASWISAARQTLLEAAEAITDEHHTELATAALCKPEAHGVSTAPKEPVVPAPDKPERYDELTAPEKLAPDTPKKIRKARSAGQRRRRMHRKRDARRARDRCQKLKAREELAARESKAREELATREELAKSEARRAREQHETWKKRDESRASDQACQLAETLLKDLPRPETVDWSPTFKVGDTNRARVTDERATHVLLLLAAVDTPMPPPLGIALCASILRSTPHAPYLRGAAPRVFGKATPKAKTKEEKDSEQVREPKPHFPPTRVAHTTLAARGATVTPPVIPGRLLAWARSRTSSNPTDARTP